MLEIINNLSPFFEDCYQRIGVREYSRMMKMSPPTASKILKSYEEEGLLIKSEDRNYLLFYASGKNRSFISLSNIYWTKKLEELIEYINSNLVSATIVLFGSASKGELKKDSDLDLAILSSRKNLDLRSFEKRIGRKIQLLWFESIKDIKNKDLANNILNGFVISGRIKL